MFSVILYTNIFISEIIFYSGLKDQDYRTSPSEEKPNKLIRLSGVPENASKEEVSLFFLFWSIKNFIKAFYFEKLRIHRRIQRNTQACLGYRSLSKLPAVLPSCVTVVEQLNQEAGFGTVHRTYQFSPVTHTLTMVKFVKKKNYDK